MKTILQLQELQKEYKRQDFNFTKEQSERYSILLQRRRDEVNQWRKDGRVWIGPSMAGKDLEE